MKTQFWFIAGLFCIAVAALAAGGYSLKKSIMLGGDGGWDYLTADAGGRRLYVSHATEVEVVDLDSGTVAGKIAGTNGVHGIAVADDLGRGFVSDGRDNQVSIFDLKTLAVTGTVKTGTNPDGILYDPFSKRVFTFNGRSKDATAIDAETGKVLGTIALGGKPEFPATDGKGNVYVNLEDASELANIDPKTLQVKAKWKVAPCESPTGLAFDGVKRRLFAVCDNKIMAVVNADNGKVVATVPTGEGTDATAFDPETKMAFASNGEDGTLTVIKQVSADKYEVVENAKTQRGARTMALDAKTHMIYLSTAEMGAAAAATAANPRPRPVVVSGTFKLLVMGR
jgi:YVTN family beta-propeller protein